MTNDLDNVFLGRTFLRGFAFWPNLKEFLQPQALSRFLVQPLFIILISFFEHLIQILNPNETLLVLVISESSQIHEAKISKEQLASVTSNIF